MIRDFKPSETTAEERQKRLSLALRCAKRHTLTRNDQTTREIEIIALAAVGMTDGDMGERLKISPMTVSAYWKRVLVRFGARTRTEAVACVLLMEIHRLRQQIYDIKAEHRMSPKEQAHSLSDE